MPDEIDLSVDAIHKHSELNNLVEVKTLLKQQPALLNRLDSKYGLTPLCWAAE